jgi:hypothetical protein
VDVRERARRPAHARRLGRNLAHRPDAEDHAGYDGVFLSLPGSGAHLEFASGGEHAPPQSHPETLLVL